MRVRWTSEARDRLAEIEAYVARDNPAAAERLIDRLVEQAERLATHPLAGRVVPEWSRDDLREKIVDGYRVVYRVLTESDEIHVLTVFEGHRLLRDDDKARL
jgi:toxin ParE1/3/4